jgi:hypothetical protein
MFKEKVVTTGEGREKIIKETPKIIYSLDTIDFSMRRCTVTVNDNFRKGRVTEENT